MGKRHVYDAIRELKKRGLTCQRALVAGAALACLAAGCGNSGTLDAAALSQQAKAVQSTAAEGALLAGDAAAGRSTHIYRRQQAAALAKAASSTTASLSTARTEPALTPKLRRLTAVAGRASRALERLGSASGSELRVLARELQSAADTSAKIAARSG